MNPLKTIGGTIIAGLVLAVIVAIAYPSFLGQIQKARRSDAKQALFEVAAKLEQYYQDNKGYPTTADMANLGYSGATFTSLEGYYTIGFDGVPTATTYTIKAVPIAPQNEDEDCYGFYLNELGEKSNREDDDTTVINNDRCW